MGGTRYVSVLGLGFGDCGKGRFVDALTRRWRAHTVVRFNGGGQAGHNVVSAGTHHTFSQFGAGTFVPGVRTMLLDPVVLHPTALLVEAEALGRKGVDDALARLQIDRDCRITMPYHQAAGRLRERLRGPASHGTCGVGVGETVRHSLTHPGQVVRYRDLVLESAAARRGLMDKMQAIRETLLAEFAPLCESDGVWAQDEEFLVLQDTTVAERWMRQVAALARQCVPSSGEALHSRLTEPGCVLFEGAQGVLLDEWRGFHPHTTWSSTTPKAADGVAARFGVSAWIEHYGVLRCYLTRHGAGPFPTCDPSLDGLLPEPHNHGEGWQGSFRRGHPDAVLLRYALEAAGGLSGLLVSHLDAVERGVKLKWCARYRFAQPHAASPWVERISPSGREDLSHQIQLTNLLLAAEPDYDDIPIDSVGGFLDRIASVTKLPVKFQSHGVTSAEIAES